MHGLGTGWYAGAQALGQQHRETQRNADPATMADGACCSLTPRFNPELLFSVFFVSASTCYQSAEPAEVSMLSSGNIGVSHPVPSALIDTTLAANRRF